MRSTITAVRPLERGAVAVPVTTRGSVNCAPSVPGPAGPGGPIKPGCGGGIPAGIAAGPEPLPLAPNAGGGMGGAIGSPGLYGGSFRVEVETCSWYVGGNFARSSFGSCGVLGPFEGAGGARSVRSSLEGAGTADIGSTRVFS